ncbi:MAG: MupA/Atu3671 family FMN-dependent luciferase-like monooxygenase [Vicinamibacterales bacterium]
MPVSIEELLGVKTPPKVCRPPINFSFLFFSDVRRDVPVAEKYRFMRDITVFGDRAGFTAVYIPERHFSEFGAIYANAAIVAAYLIPQTTRIRFRTAGISLPLHHPAEVVEWWAMNDNLSGGRVDLGFGSGWSKPDFILAPDAYENRREICAERIEMVRELWRGGTVYFPGPDHVEIPVTVYPRPVQKELNVWLLITQNDEAFAYAGKQGFNVFTMLYGVDLEALRHRIAIYREARAQAGLDPAAGVVSLMLHTLVHRDLDTVRQVVERPFKEYIRSSLDGHVAAGLGTSGRVGLEDIGEREKAKMLDYAYERYFSTCALFGSVDDGRQVVEHAIQAGVNEIACLVDFGVDYGVVKDSLPHLETLVSSYR